MYSFAAATVVNDFRVETINEIGRVEAGRCTVSWVLGAIFAEFIFFSLGSLFLFVSCGQLEMVQRRRNPSAKFYTCMAEQIAYYV